MAIATTNPTTGEVVKTFDALSEQELDDRLERAAVAFRSYRRTSYEQRAGWLRAAADLLEAEADATAELMTLEMGKTVKEAKGEVTYGQSRSRRSLLCSRSPHEGTQPRHHLLEGERLDHVVVATSRQPGNGQQILCDDT